MTAVTEIWAYRNLVYNLAQRELRARYKKSFLGWLWSLINPAAMLAIYTLVFGVFLRVPPPPLANGDSGVFALYLFAGLLTWNYFAGIVNGAIGALQGSGGLLNKVYFPPAIPALANMITILLQALIEAAILAVVMIAIGNFSITMALFPLVLVLLGMFALGLGLFLSVFNIYYRDVGYLVGLGMQILFYVTPIVYPLAQVPAEAWGLPVQDLIKLNPMTQFVEWSRDAFYDLTWPSLVSFAGVAAVSVLTLVVGWAVFTRKARNIAEEL